MKTFQAYAAALHNAARQSVSQEDWLLAAKLKAYANGMEYALALLEHLVNEEE